MSRITLASIAAAALFAAACSSHPGENVGSADESLGIMVHHPEALGGGTHKTFFAAHTTPEHVYPATLPIVDRALSDDEGTIKVMANGTLPTSIDISANAPVPGDQGQTGSCAAWATGYSS